jgi:predicted  nucleic acid-binding Zn-ribbon protein
MHEIDLLKAKHSALDDVELEAMDQQANAEEAMALLDRREPELLAALADAQAALDAAEASLAADAAGLMAERGVASAALSEAETSLYTSLKARHGGMGIAQLERHTCTGCHVDLSQVEYEQVVHTPAGELPECPHCARLLVV